MKRNPLFGLLIVWTGWALGFLGLYTLQATGCRAGWDTNILGAIPLLRLLLIVSTAGIAALLFWLSVTVRPKDPGSSFGQIIVLTNGAAVLALVCFAGVLWLSLCT